MSKKTKIKKRKELLLKLNKELKDIQRQINFSRYHNLRNAGIRNLKIVTHLAFGTLPVLITTPIVVGSLYIMSGYLPFVIDEIEKKEEILKEIDSNGQYRIERHFEDLNNKNEILCYGTWNQIGNEKFQRQVDKYSFKDFKEEELLKVLETGNLSLISEIIGEPYTYIEEKRELTEEEYNNSDPYIKAFLYDENEDSIVVYTESFKDNLAFTAFEIVMIIILATSPTAHLWSSNGYDPISKIKEEIASKKSKEDINLLKKKLEIRKDNLNRLRR